uniref:Uncharacterized protein n=1 Tax=Anguilla anguilla TaxID=7936 RepID=A0A0E9UJ56_ANGAN
MSGLRIHIAFLHDRFFGSEHFNEGCLDSARIEEAGRLSGDSLGSDY